jgi:CRISPR/Cas system CMR subunit Cmr6 (Cas7 group RAMP superfamily)
MYLKPDYAQMEAIDFLTRKEEQPPKSWQELGEVSDPSARLSLLTQAIITAYKDYSRMGRRGEAGLIKMLGMLEQHYIEQYNNFLSPLSLNPVIPDISMFPQGSWAVSFKFKLRKPYISRDDTDFYIIDNPIRKEWVFKMPYIAASQWKGALRAAMVKLLVEKADSLSDETFAKWRFHLALMFGDEKGEGELNGLAGYLDNAKLLFICWNEFQENDKFIEFLEHYFCLDWIRSSTFNRLDDGRTIKFSHEKHSLSLVLDNDKTKAVLTIDNKKIREFIVKVEKEKIGIFIPYAAYCYRKKIRKFFDSKDYELPSHAGWLCFYPTYFTRIGLEVINPHDRETGAGAQPIYFECVPSGAEGGFVLLYVPLYRKGDDRDTIKNHAILDLQLVAYGISALMTQFGFGAKTTGGFGLAEDFVSDGFVALDVDSIGDSRDGPCKICEIPEKFKKYLNDDGTVNAEFCGNGKSGLLSNKEFGEQKKGKGWNSTEFQEFKNWHKMHGKEIVKEKQGKKEGGRGKGLEFKDFGELKNIINSLTKKITGEDGFV